MARRISHTRSQKGHQPLVSLYNVTSGFCFGDDDDSVDASFCCCKAAESSSHEGGVANTDIQTPPEAEVLSVWAVVSTACKDENNERNRPRPPEANASAMDGLHTMDATTDKRMADLMSSRVDLLAWFLILGRAGWWGY